MTVEYDSCTQKLYGNPKSSLPIINGSCYYLVFKDQIFLAQK